MHKVERVVYRCAGLSVGLLSSKLCLWKNGKFPATFGRVSVSSGADGHGSGL